MAERFVVDTMVFGYALYDEPEFRLEANEALLRARRGIVAVDNLPRELLKVGYGVARYGRKTEAEVIRAIETAERMVKTWIPTRPLFARALALSVEQKHHPYDTLLVAAGEARGARVLTFDRPLRRKFGEERVQLVSEFLAG